MRYNFDIEEGRQPDLERAKRETTVPPPDTENALIGYCVIEKEPHQSILLIIVSKSQGTL
jgi:hypothetical protein